MARDMKCRVIQPATRPPTERYCAFCATVQPADTFTRLPKPTKVPGKKGRVTHSCAFCQEAYHEAREARSS